MPTTRPRYTFTDTGHLRELLDAAAQRWPDVEDRKALLLRLAEEGSGALALDDRQQATVQQRLRAQAALERIAELIDTEVLLSDQAWS